MSGSLLPSSTSNSQDLDRPQVFLLNILGLAPGWKLRRGQVTSKLKTKAAEAAGMHLVSFQDNFKKLETENLVRINQARGTAVYELTDEGAQRLAGLQALLPVSKGRGGIKLPANDKVRTYRTAYLLMQVLRGENQSVRDGEANKSLDTYAREGLELNAATASGLRVELVSRGLLTIQGHGRGATYSLTQEGRVALGNSRFEEGRKFQVSGEVLNLLLEAGREVGKQFATSSPSASLPKSDELARIVLAKFAELRRERHGDSGLVPIHEVRLAMRNQFGDAAARHDVLDEVILGLWRSKRLRLVPITDPSKTDQDQIRDSIPGEGDTLFYLEAAREPAVL